MDFARMRACFVEIYGDAGENLDEQTWYAWFGIWAIAWIRAIEEGNKGEAHDV